MSGSRAPALQLVFCHSCQNEFYKDGDALVCPRCSSDFTELIDNDFDQRADTATSLSRHHPWAGTADDPDEDDIDQFRREPGSSWRDRRPLHEPWARRDEPFAGPTPNNDPVFGNFASMIHGMTGNQRSPAFFPPPSQPQQSRGWHDGPQGLAAWPGQRLGRAVSESRTSPTSQVYSRTYRGNGNGVHISFTSSTNTGGGWQRQQGGHQEFDNFNDLFNSILGSMGPPPGARGADGQPPNPFAAIFSQILNPANASHGDAVYTQEAFDRVMSQLMEQHTTGGAPGPATEAAISALPKKKVTDDMLDETTKQAECSICMDNVVIDEEVVVLPCFHWFHYDCVEAWLKEHDTCPVCRAGITPKDGPRDTARAPTEAPLHDEDPFLLARQQSGTREHPFVVPESPTSQRRRPNTRRHSSDQASSSRQHGAEGAGLWDRARNWLSPGNDSNGNGNGGSARSKR